MRLFCLLLLCFSVFAVPARAADPLIEEAVLLTTFNGIYNAETYDRLCNGGKIVKGDAATTPSTANLFGNMEMIGRRLSLIWLAKNPGRSAEDATSHLTDLQTKAIADIEPKIAKSGCETALAKKIKEDLVLYASQTPAQLTVIIDRFVVEEGGAVSADVSQAP